MGRKLRVLRNLVFSLPLVFLGGCGGGGGGNKPQAPDVVLNIAFNEDGTYNYTAQASDSDGSVSYIDIIADGTPVQRQDGNATAGTLETKEANKLEAIATDNQGLTGYDAKEWKTAKSKDIYDKLDGLLKSNPATYAEFQGSIDGIEVMLDNNLPKAHFLITRKDDRYSAITIGDIESELGKVVGDTNMLRDYGIPTKAFIRVPITEVEPRFNAFRDNEYE